MDQLDTPRDARDQSGNIVWSWNSDAFGSVPPVASSGVTINLRFPGQYYDQESGLYYNYHRDYDPNSGRYAESDPIGLRGGINTYAYVGGNPVNFVDPWGLASLIYDNNAQTLTILDGHGNVVGMYPAANNAQSTSRGPWPAGHYTYSYHTTHPDDGTNSAYGSYGNFIFNVPRCVGCGVHSGRANTPDRVGRSGPRHATNGCIRTTDDATRQIQQLIQGGDPLTDLWVTR